MSDYRHFKPPMPTGDTAPQPPRTCTTGYCHCIVKDKYIAALEAQLAEAQRLLACFLDKPEDRMYHAEDGTWWRRDGDRLLSADPPSELADAQVRLAMVTEAILRYQKDEVALDEGEVEPPYLATALTATAADVAAFIERDEKRGAAKDRAAIAAWLREYAKNPKWSDPEVQHFAGHAADYIAEGWFLEARAGELEGK